MFKSIALMSGAAFVLAAHLAAAPQQEKPDATRPPTGQTPAKGGGSTAGQTPAKEPGSMATPTEKKGEMKSAAAQTKGATGATANFIKKTGENGAAEVELARSASTKATDPQVKAFADMLATDHSKGNDELMALAKQKNITVSTEVAGANKATRDRLEKLSGAAFDKAYVSDMLKAHQNAIRDFEQASKSGDPDVKAFADKMLPTLRHHLEEAQRLSKAEAGASTKGKGTKSPTEPKSGRSTGYGK